jgi:NAD(P)-dependent dehydrogenase (short-subunit alcohol dehydrogenase family)
MTRQLATDYGPRGIRVNAIAPGQIETPLTADRISGDPRFVAFNVDPIPFPRLGRPEDIANAVFFLASDQASYINGHTLVVDGGWTISSFSRRGYEM